MIPSLPEELLAELLSCHCTVPDHVFFSSTCTSQLEPIPSWRPNPSILLVSKQWRRIALRNFYTTVIVRSETQCISLKATLRSNPMYVSSIKRLRIESGYSMALRDVIHLVASNIQDLSLSLAFGSFSKDRYSYDLYESMLKGLRPRRVGVIDTPLEYWFAGSREMLKTQLSKAIQCDWDQLEIFYFPYTRNLFPETSCTIVSALSLSSGLHTVFVPNDFDAQYHLALLATCESLKRITVTDQFCELSASSHDFLVQRRAMTAEERAKDNARQRARQREFVEGNKRLKGLIVYE